MRKRLHAPTALSTAALALAVIAVARGQLGPQVAAAQDQADRRVLGSKAAPPFNPSAQRVAMLKQLEQINKNLAAIAGKLDKGLTVKVSEMPAIVIPPQDPAGGK